VSTPDVRDAVPADLDRVAQLHVDAFPDSVLGHLGVEAVRRSYLWQMEGPHDLTALVGMVDGRVEGFLFGGVFRGSTIGFVKKEKWFLAGQVARHPSVMLGRMGWDRIGLALRLLRTRWTAPTPEDPTSVPTSSFGVLAIAVDPAAQGHGIGRSLMDVATARARSGGFTSMHLSVHPENAPAIAFYRSIGWSEVPEDDGNWTGRMTASLSADRPPTTT
jgi:ribosomal protein S18 acetylase RimI-like enzyme